MRWKKLVVAGVVLVLDQVTKSLIRQNMPLGSTVPVLPGILDLTHLANTGAAWGIFKGMNIVFILVSFAALAYLIFGKVKDKYHAVPILTGGIAGNLVDRLFVGHVTDFIDVGFWPVFNVADSALSIGIVLMIIAEFTQHRRISYSQPSQRLRQKRRHEN